MYDKGYESSAFVGPGNLEALYCIIAVVGFLLSMSFIIPMCSFFRKFRQTRSPSFSATPAPQEVYGGFYTNPAFHNLPFDGSCSDLTNEQKSNRHSFQQQTDFPDLATMSDLPPYPNFQDETSSTDQVPPAEVIMSVGAVPYQEEPQLTVHQNEMLGNGVGDNIGVQAKKDVFSQSGNQRLSFVGGGEGETGDRTNVNIVDERGTSNASRYNSKRNSIGSHYTGHGTHSLGGQYTGHGAQISETIVYANDGVSYTDRMSVNQNEEHSGVNSTGQKVRRDLSMKRGREHLYYRTDTQQQGQSFSNNHSNFQTSSDMNNKSRQNNYINEDMARNHQDTFPNKKMRFSLNNRRSRHNSKKGSFQNEYHSKKKGKFYVNSDQDTGFKFSERSLSNGFSADIIQNNFAM